MRWRDTISHLNGGLIKDVSIDRCCSFARDVQIGHGFHPTARLSVSPLQYGVGYRGGMQQVLKPVPFDWASRTTIGNDAGLGHHGVVAGADLRAIAQQPGG